MSTKSSMLLALYHNRSRSLRKVRGVKKIHSFVWIHRVNAASPVTFPGNHLLGWLGALWVLSLTAGCGTFPAVAIPPMATTAATPSTVPFNPIGDIANHAIRRPMTPSAAEAKTSFSTIVPAKGVLSHPSPQKPFQFPLLQVGNKGSAVLRLQELLAEQGYLPLTWSAKTRVSNTLVAQIQAINQAPTGSWLWTATWPVALKGLWQPGVYTVVTKGAVMTFESAHGLQTDGIAGPQVWSTLLQSRLRSQHSPWPYAYVYVSEGQPEQLTLWSDGQVALHTLANTGIPQAPTALGTWLVYLRYKSQTMSGTLPDGQTYQDPGVPWVNYFNGGDAVHGFPRAAYGFPQSLGCVELPIPQAAKAWNYIHYGTLVTVAP